MSEKERYEELVRKLKTSHKTFEKMQRKIMNEPDSESKWVKLELMALVLNRSSEIVNWWDNCEKKQMRKEMLAKAQERHEQKLRNKEKAEKSIAQALEKYDQEWNYGCRYYNQDSMGQRSCSCGMDMTFCTKNCAFATNTVGSTRVYDAPTYENGRRKV